MKILDKFHNVLTQYDDNLVWPEPNERTNAHMLMCICATFIYFFVHFFFKFKLVSICLDCIQIQIQIWILYSILSHTPAHSYVYLKWSCTLLNSWLSCCQCANHLIGCVQFSWRHIPLTACCIVYTIEIIIAY